MAKEKKTEAKPAKKRAEKKTSTKKRERSKEPRPLQKTDVSDWKPQTALGIEVKNREIMNIDEILDTSRRIMESEITDTLLPNMEQELLLIGQSKGKFGGGSRRVFRQTQKKTMEGNKPKFSTIAVIGDKDGHLGIGFGKAKETVPAREKAIKKAKLEVFKIRRGCGSWECACKTPHSVPFAVEGKCGSVRLKIMPAPKGKGLCCEDEIAKILKLAGIKDAWTKTQGQTKNRINFIYACEDALRKLVKTKHQPQHIESHAIAEGSVILKDERVEVQEE